MGFHCIVSRDAKTSLKTVLGIFSLFAIVLILPSSVAAIQTALVRASDGNVYQIRFPNPHPSRIGEFIDDFSIYDATGTVELCPGNAEHLTRELYTAARVLAQTPRTTPLFDTSALEAKMIQTGADAGIINEDGEPIDAKGVIGSIVEEMAVDKIQGEIQSVVDPSLNLGLFSINPRTWKIKANLGAPLILANTVEAIRRLGVKEIEGRGMLYAFSRTAIYANTAIHLQELANRRAARLWDSINAGDIIDGIGDPFSITQASIGDAFTINEASVEISETLTVYDPFRLRVAATVYQDYAEHAVDLGTDLSNPETSVATLAKQISIDIITDFLSVLGAGQGVLREKEALDELDAQLGNSVVSALQESRQVIYDAATSDLTQHGFCAPGVRFTAIPPTVPEGDTFTYTVALNSTPNFGAIIAISTDNPDVTVSPTSLTFLPDQWYIPKSVVVDVSADADSTDESVSLRHVIVGYGDGTVREFQIDITDQVSNQAPRPADTIPDQTLTNGDFSDPLDLSTYFHDPDDDTLTYTVVSSDPNVAIAQRAGSQLTVWTLNVGNTTFTVTATDPEGLFITQTFTVTVNPAPVQQGPEQVGTISTQYMTLDGGAKTVDVAPYFSSPNTLRYEVSSSPLGFVRASISGSQVTITPLQVGSASVFVTARDPQNPNLSAIQTIPVSVSHAIIVRPPTPEPFTPPTTTPDVEGLREGISVITQLTPGFRLNVRERPGTDEDIVEQLGSGIIGTITDGPVRADGFRWWDIEWDIRGLDLEGWSAESDRGQILFRRPPDLEIQDLDVSKDEVEPGDRFTVEVRVRNNGPGESAPTEVSVYYSLKRHRNRSEFNADRNKYEVGTIRIPALRAGRRTERSLRVTAPGTPDRYYYGALLPSNIHPTDYTRDLPSDARENDLAPQERVEVTTAPDLIVAAIASDTSVLDPGETFRLEVTVRNQGIGEPETDATLRYYRSSNARISDSDTEVGTDFVRRRDLDTNGTGNESISLTAPNEPGIYYYGACVETVGHENNTHINCSGAIAITVRAPVPQPTVENEAPVAVGVIPPQSLTIDGEAATVDLSASFSDANGDTLTYAAWPDDKSVVKLQRTGTLLTITPEAVGQTTVIARATDPDGLSAFQRISVSVNTLEIDIETDGEPPSEPDIEITTEVPDLVVESIRVGKTEMAPGAVFRMDAVILNQGTAPSGKAQVRFYRSDDETITPADTQMKTADLPAIAVDATRNKWIRLTAPNTAGVYYYGVCIEGVADESDTENNCSTAVKITVETLPDKPPTVEKPKPVPETRVEKPKPVPETGVDPLPVDSLAEQVFQRYGQTLRRRDVKAVLPNVLTALKEPHIQKLLVPATIKAVIENPDLLKKMVPTISDEFIVLLKTDAEIKKLLSDPQVQTLLQTRAAIDALAKLLGIRVAPTTTPGGTVTFRDPSLANKVREALNLPAGAAIPKAKLARLTHLNASVYGEGGSINNLTGLEHATQLKTLLLVNHRVSDLTPLAGLKRLETLDFASSFRLTDINPLKGLTNLRRLFLDGVGSRSPRDLTPLAGLKKLEDLALFRMALDDNAFTPLVPLLTGLTKLRRLDLAYNRISNANLLTGLTRLRELDVRSNQIADVTPLTRLTNLKKLWVGENPITNEAQFQEILRQNPGLKLYTKDLQNAPAAPVSPNETALLPNYPNPFNPETWIPYQLAKDADVTVTIYDVRGGIVRRLALGHQPPGFYYDRGRAVHWDGRNALGEQVASGLYFYTFTAGDFTATQKLLIRK